MRTKLVMGGFAAVVAFLLATNPLVAQAAEFITSADIVNSTIKSNDIKGKDIRDSTLTGADVSDNSLTGTDVSGLSGADVDDNSLTGADVSEGTLSAVPSATNATNLNGQPASAYLNASYRYLLPVATPATTRTYSFPGLPAGTYVASFHAVFDTAAVGHAVLCHFNVGGDLEALTYRAPAQFGSVSSTAATTVLSISSVTMTCNTQNSANRRVATGRNPSRVTFTKIDNLTSSDAARSAAAGSRGGPAN